MHLDAAKRTLVTVGSGSMAVFRRTRAVGARPQLTILKGLILAGRRLRCTFEANGLFPVPRFITYGAPIFTGLFRQSATAR